MGCREALFAFVQSGGSRSVRPDEHARQAKLREDQAKAQIARLSVEQFGKRNVRTDGHFRVRGRWAFNDDLQGIVKDVALAILSPGDLLWPRVESRLESGGTKYIHTVYWGIRSRQDAMGLLNNPCRDLVSFVEQYQPPGYDLNVIKTAYWDAEPELGDLCALELDDLRRGMGMTRRQMRKER